MAIYTEPRNCSNDTRLRNRIFAIIVAVLLCATATTSEAASYLELRNLGNNSDLRSRTEIAVLVAANDVLRASPAAPDEQVGWAQAVIASPGPWAQRALWIALAENRDLTVAQITGATDAALQAAIDAVVPVLAKGMVPGG